MAVKITWDQALAWRMQRQLLEPGRDLAVEDVVRRLGGVQAQVASSAELAINLRRTASEPGDVNRALSEGRVIKTWAMRGTLHLLTPEEGGAFLSLLASGRSWERPSWERYFRMDRRLWGLMRATVREALGTNAVSREELVAAIVKQPKLAHLGDELRSGWGTLFKPLAWQGELCFGPSQGNRATFMRPEAATPRWAGVPEPDEAAPLVLLAYLGAYGPATSAHLGRWLARGRIRARQLRSWFAELGERLAEVEVDGEILHARAEDVDDLAATKSSKTVRLLPGFDGWVLGPGTEDVHIVARARRAFVSRQSGWISPVVVAGGRVSGTWTVDGGEVLVDWFREAGRPPTRVLEEEVARLASVSGASLSATVRLA